jgi:hypothetical protein
MDDSERARVLLLRVVESVTSGSRRRRRLASERYVPFRCALMIRAYVRYAGRQCFLSRSGKGREDEAFNPREPAREPIG